MIPFLGHGGGELVSRPVTAEVEAEILCPTSGVVFFALKKPLTTEHEVAFKVIRRLFVNRS